MNHRMTGTLEGVTWPPLFAAQAPLAALVETLEATQWLPVEELRVLQGIQLSALIAFHAKGSTTLQTQLTEAGLAAADFADIAKLARLPIQSRGDLDQLAKSMPRSDIPASHFPVVETFSSGSTGIPVTVRKTQINKLMWSSLTVRYHRWSEAEAFGKLAVIRTKPPEPLAAGHWPPPVSLLHETGPIRFISIDDTIAEQAARIKAFKPDSLMAYPSQIEGLVRTTAGRRALASVKSIKTFTATVSPDLRDAVAAHSRARLFDCYSAQEPGYIALQCPDTSSYHIMSESVIVEIVDEDGRPTPAGEVGRVLVTDLLNLATPIIRYDIGDYAIAGGRCSCGRGLPTLQRIMGRKRGMILSRNGSRQWPGPLFSAFRGVVPIIQYQMFQHACDRFELRLLTGKPLSTKQGSQLTEIIRAAMKADVVCDIQRFADRLPPGPNGKVEDFMCLIGE